MEGKKVSEEKKMKKYSVEIDTHIWTTFEEVEANSKEEAKELALEMFFDDPSQYIEIDENFDMDVHEEEADATPQKS